MFASPARACAAVKAPGAPARATSLLGSRVPGFPASSSGNGVARRLYPEVDVYAEQAPMLTPADLALLAELLALPRRIIFDDNSDDDDDVQQLSPSAVSDELSEPAVNTQ